jgi:cell division protein FtsW (lipid II flippase)
MSDFIAIIIGLTLGLIGTLIVWLPLFYFAVTMISGVTHG